MKTLQWELLEAISEATKDDNPTTKLVAESFLKDAIDWWLDHCENAVRIQMGDKDYHARTIVRGKEVS